MGRHVVAALQRAGIEALAGVRRAGSGPAEVAARVVDATDAGSLRAALEGVGAVVNAVAGDPATMARATEAVLAAAAPRRVVHLSSMAVYGPATGVVAEDAPLAPEGDYGESKAASDRAVLAHVGRGGTR
ncbi:NAD-dependent epimerase/dehydratase family protein [Roseomonas sp. CCTCC AB2023176]|uniref:NAD-dependent epimerase/dehydratase family protein n=1 Tax=Roseomonas sp. CCTCC AB2023176 TaxID=3342640 RepID=UPI0035E14080